VLVFLNFIYLIVYKKGETKHQKGYVSSPKQLIFIQIIVDLILLTFLLHYSGGVENPFIIYFVFHLIIASILLSRSKSYLIAIITIILVGILVIGEYSGFITHYKLSGFLSGGYYNDLNYLKGTGFIFITTSFVVVYLTSTVSDQLRKKEQAYRQANIELREKDKIKNEYVYQITHDIKGHLGAIKNCLDAVIILGNKEQKQEFINRAHGRTLRLINLLQDLLKITQLRLSDKLVLETISINEILDDVLESYNNRAKVKGITFLINIDQKLSTVHGNKLLITEAFSNLISNSIKYSHDNDKIYINAVQKADNIMIEFKDNGVRIPESEIQYIYNEFYRASNIRRFEKDSSGLGLTIVKQIIKNHKGNISIDSEINGGTSFKLFLPVQTS